MITLICFIISIFAGIVYLSSCVGSFRSRDIFAKIQFIKNLGLYAMNLIILSFALSSSDPAIIVKSIIAMILNITSVNILMYMIADLAHQAGTEPDSKKKSLIKKKRRASR